jgi:hypothetical protein
MQQKGFFAVESHNANCRVGEQCKKREIKQEKENRRRIW